MPETRKREQLVLIKYSINEIIELSIKIANWKIRTLKGRIQG